jgi:cytochrome d ubiquinol oxidase subunit I
MVILGFFFLGLFLLTGWLSWKDTLHQQRWLLWIALWGIPLAWICSESGWIVAEVGRQPWVIQDIMPTYAAVSALNPTSVLVTSSCSPFVYRATHCRNRHHSETDP